MNRLILVRVETSLLAQQELTRIVEYDRCKDNAKIDASMSCFNPFWHDFRWKKVDDTSRLERHG